MQFLDQINAAYLKNINNKKKNYQPQTFEQ